MMRLQPLRTALATARPRIAVPARSYATKKPPSVTSQFYKQFTRPVAKVLLLAVFTYQVAYWGWVKLETDEVRAERAAEIAALEKTVDAYKTAQAGDKAAKSA